MAQSKNVLVIGVDPRTIPGIDADAVEALLAVGLARFETQGIAADMCYISIDETAERIIIEHLHKKPYACVVVGGGIRKPEPLLEFFERVINLIRYHAPEAAIAFNTSPDNSVEAAMRWLDKA